MEEILASIRRIIADDQDTQRPAPAAAWLHRPASRTRFSTLPTFEPPAPASPLELEHERPVVPGR